ncbi:hypothetical protein [Haloarchaeobius amylolyticus]|uniref:hypothetical protein n=1 Tax=Haloarchaeobius amylolyticus TaxID=1198296 RepID=UPI002271DA0C|nr:hypothetical protein [Haloarchaeobius amylolyticus]
MSIHKQTYDTTAWTESVVKEYLTATSQQKDDPEKFYDTHLDIDKIHAEFLGSSFQNEFVTQEEFRDEILSGDVDDDIRTYILRGETGAGKSQLCQWLDYELQGIGDADDVEKRVPLHIKASETSLEEIISTLAEPLDVDPEVDQVTELNATDIAEGIVASIKANPGPALKDVDLTHLLSPKQGDLGSVLEENIKAYQKGLQADDETEFDPNLISKEDYRDIRLKLGTDSIFHNDADRLRQALRDEIHRHFSHLIGVDDFQGQLRDYTKRMVQEQGRRPVIICEDVTTFSVLKEQLLDQIIQVESASFDIVLGYTTGFEQDDLQDALGSRGSEEPLTYLKDRAEGYLSLTDEGEAYFLDDNISVELVRKYLDVIKRESGGSVDESVEDGFDGLYPFNRAFIRRTYQNLQEDGSPRRTPRVLLQKVIRRCLLSEDQPYEVVEKSTNVSDIVPTVDPARYDDTTEQVATWYGIEDEGSDKITVAATVFDAFGIDVDGVVTDEREGRTYYQFEPNSMANQILTPTQKPSTREQTPESATEDDDDEQSDDTATSDSTGETETSPGSTEQEESNRRQSQVKEFYDWVKTGDDYESSERLRSGAEDLLERWHDPTRLANPNANTRGTKGIYYTRSDSIPVSIQGPNERQGLDIMLPFGEKNMQLYMEILGYELNDGFQETTNIEQLHSWATDKVVGFRQDMRAEIEACLPAGLTIEHCFLLGKYLLLNGELGVTSLDAEDVFTEINLEEREYESPIRAALGHNHALSEVLTDLWQRNSDINGLIEGFFLLKSNVVDYERLQPVRTDIASDPQKYLQLAQRIDTEELDYPSAYGVGTTRSNANVQLTKVLDAISDYAIEVEMLADDDLRNHFEDHLEPVEKWYDPSHDVSELIDMFERLEDCLGTFGVAKEASWSEVKDLLTDDETNLRLSEFERHVEDFLNPDPETPFERVAILHSFAESRENHHAWEVYRALDEMIETLDEYNVAESTDLTDKLSELAELSEYESARVDVRTALEDY